MGKNKLSTYIFLAAFVVVLAAVIISAISTQSPQNPQKEAADTTGKTLLAAGSLGDYIYPDVNSGSRTPNAPRAAGTGGGATVDNVNACPFFNLGDDLTADVCSSYRADRPKITVAPGKQVQFILPSEDRIYHKYYSKNTTDWRVNDWKSSRFSWLIQKEIPSEYIKTFPVSFSPKRCNGITDANCQGVQTISCNSWGSNTEEPWNCWKNPQNTSIMQINIPYPNESAEYVILDKITVNLDQPQNKAVEGSNMYIMSNIKNSNNVLVTRGQSNLSEWPSVLPIGSARVTDCGYGEGCWEHITEWQDIAPGTRAQQVTFNYFKKPVFYKNVANPNGQLSFLLSKNLYTSNQNSGIWLNKASGNMQVTYRLNDDGPLGNISCSETTTGLSDVYGGTYKTCTFNLPPGAKVGDSYMITGMVHVQNHQHNQFYPIFVTVGGPSAESKASCAAITLSKGQLEVKPDGDSVVVTGKGSVTVPKGMSVDSYKVTKMSFVVAKPGSNPNEFINLMPWQETSDLSVTLDTTSEPGKDKYIYSPRTSLTLKVSGNELISAKSSGVAELKVLLKVQTADSNWVSEDVTRCESSQAR